MKEPAVINLASDESEEEDKQPDLCILCESIADKNAVAVADLDATKLKNWWLESFNVEMEKSVINLTKAKICRFCIEDAIVTFERENSSVDKGKEIDWWTSCGSKIPNHVIEPKGHFPMEVNGKTIQQEKKFTSFNEENSPEQKKRRTDGSENEKKPPVPPVMNEQQADNSCKYCELKFSSLRKHLLSNHTNEQNYVCPYPECKILRTKGVLLRHIAYDHKLNRNFDLTYLEQKPYPCKMCNHLFKSENRLNQHIEFFHLKKTLDPRLYVPKKSLRSIEMLELSQKWNAKVEKIPCIICNEFIVPSMIKQHCKIEHEILHICRHPNCFDIFADQQLESKHYDSEHPEMSKSELLHPKNESSVTKQLSGITENPYACMYCKLQFRSEFALECHNEQKVCIQKKAKESSNFKFFCDACQVFVPPAIVDTHIKTFHGKSHRLPKWKFACNICKCIMKPADIGNHMKAHEGGENSLAGPKAHESPVLKPPEFVSLPPPLSLGSEIESGEIDPLSI